jgi:hypothetical protein
MYFISMFEVEGVLVPVSGRISQYPGMVGMNL